MKKLISKIIIFIIIFLIIPAPFFILVPCECPPGALCGPMLCEHGWEIIPFGGIVFLLSIFIEISNFLGGGVIFSWSPYVEMKLIITAIFLFIFPYLFSHLAIFILNKFKKKPQ